MSSIVLEKSKIVGEGAYGIVYECYLKDENKSKKLAFKRNYGDPENLGTSCLREMYFLKSVNHRNVIKLLKVFKNDPFSEHTPLSPKNTLGDMHEDNYHFLFEFVDSNLEDFYKKDYNINDIKGIMFQITNGVDYLHKNKIIHRDLKPANILIKYNDKKENEGNGKKYEVKICDFGLTMRANKYRPSTPGAVTAYYRAPEICCGYEDYSFPIDMWSLGCIFFEIVSKKILIEARDKSEHLFRKILSVLPNNFKKTELDLFLKKGDCNFDHRYDERKFNNNKKSFKTRIKKEFDNEDREQWDELEGFCNLLNKILRFAPYERLTSEECLLDEFFSPYNDKYVSGKYKNKKRKINDEVKIIDCFERRKMREIVKNIYKNREKLDWYNIYVLFHSIELFDRYLYYHYPKDAIREDTNIDDKKNDCAGLVLTEKDIGEVFYTCIYANYKTYSCLNYLEEWSTIFPKRYAKRKNKVNISRIETKIIEEVCDYKILNNTLIELIDDKSVDKDEELIEHFLFNYVDIEENYFGDVDDLYNQIKNEF